MSVASGAQAPHEPRIEVHQSTGRIMGGSAVERCGIRVARFAAAMSQRIDDFGQSHAARLIAKALPGRAVVRIVLAEDSVFEMPYGDRYWGRLLPKGAIYEPELRAVLSASAGTDYAFIDCGANYGYWSVLVSSRAFGAHPVVAIEAAPDTFAWLSRNARSNDGRFAVLNRAVGERTGETVDLYGTSHEGRSTVPLSGAVLAATVETLALDDLIEQPPVSAAHSIVLKLDVEGAEIPALRGAGRLRERNLLVAYEDHGSDPTHSVTAYIADAMKLRVYAVSNGRAARVASVDHLTSIKRNPRAGYDFFATDSQTWIEMLEGMGRGAAPSAR